MIYKLKNNIRVKKNIKINMLIRKKGIIKTYTIFGKVLRKKKRHNNCFFKILTKFGNNNIFINLNTQSVDLIHYQIL